MGLVTTLDTMALADVLQWIDGARKTGILRVTRGKANAMFHFTEGRLTGGTSNDPPLLLGQFLLSRGKITEDTLHEALELQEKNHRLLGDILLQMGAVTAEELERACVAKAEETIFGLLEWTEAMVEFDPEAKPAVCCGPNIVNFSKLATLQEMVSHIYGRLSLLTNPDRPHLFIRELAIYVDHLRKELEKYSLDLSSRAPKYFREFKENLLCGIEYYRCRAEHFIDEKRNHFLDDLRSLGEALERMTLVKPLNE